MGLHRGKSLRDQAGDIDMVTMFTDGCRREVPLGTAQVPIQAKIEIAMIEAPRRVRLCHPDL